MVISPPILKDKIYSAENESPFNKHPLFLHAYSIVIPLYLKKDPIEVKAGLPVHMQEFIVREF
jgi:23S rRNA-/tRNA-specific pseudouridylate synthase